MDSWKRIGCIRSLLTNLENGRRPLSGHEERRYFSVIDGIIAGEGQGPFCSTSKNANTLIAVEDLLAVDAVAVRYMGFDPEKIRHLKYFLDKQYDDVTLENILVYEDGRQLGDYFEKNTDRCDPPALL